MRDVDLSVSRRALGARNVRRRRQYRLSDMYYRRQWRGEARGEVQRVRIVIGIFFSLFRLSGAATRQFW